MTVNELLARFPEVPNSLADEPLLAEFARRFDPMIRVARKPSPCVRDYDADHVFYLKLINDLAIYGMGLAKREKTLARVQGLLDEKKKNPATYGCSLVPSRPRGAPRDLGCEGLGQ